MYTVSHVHHRRLAAWQRHLPDVRKITKAVKGNRSSLTGSRWRHAGKEPRAWRPRWAGVRLLPCKGRVRPPLVFNLRGAYPGPDALSAIKWIEGLLAVLMLPHPRDSIG